MMEWLSTVGVGDIGAGALTAVFIISILRGWLVPRRILMDLRGDRDQRIHELIRERDDWKTAFHLSEERAKVLTDAIDDVLESTRAAEALIRALPMARNDDG